MSSIEKKKEADFAKLPVWLPMCIFESRINRCISNIKPFFVQSSIAAKPERHWITDDRLAEESLNFSDYDTSLDSLKNHPFAF